ncbi:hypothetical protein WN943_027270 [Citrus x changshan-huyou]
MKTKINLAYTIKITEKYDVYDFGVLVLEVIKGKHPWIRCSFRSFSFIFQCHLMKCWILGFHLMHSLLEKWESRIQTDHYCLSFKYLPSFLIAAQVNYTYHAYAGLNSEQKNVNG